MLLAGQLVTEAAQAFFKGQLNSPFDPFNSLYSQVMVPVTVAVMVPVRTTG